ncbi:WecB/TagA/CpsF family glycosyltransferase [Aeromicrobium sp. YIM 150415]|uniref:WecB/TagA/CpsF family glycosyltransferase n=1 Tax=Aeromicrobium sp. YIM 150415 TaxID=2803912 RepID=UPI001964ACD1|nr:WecB/TagA/CpsF family glycosyltransferase [Aeromicrobium sp. YIM 150415]MBM9463421.1 WecB/TagA/CpsF family glycosyltransferase [Aeromicrobium sp. YIM 150415]
MATYRKAPARDTSTIRIGAFETIRITREQLADRMVDDCISAREAREKGKAKIPKLVFSSNGQGIALAGQNGKFERLMGAADIVHADGMPVVLASRLTRHPIAERIATTDFFHDAARAAAGAGLRFFFLGGTEKQNAEAVARVREEYPTLSISGRQHGYFLPEEVDELRQRIVSSETDVVWVALGKPAQEEWCVKMRHELRGVGWLKTCGGLYSFLADEAPRAPRWMQAAGLEWLHRVVNDPRRLLWRYATTNPYAAYRILRHTDWSRRSPRA